MHASIRILAAASLGAALCASAGTSLAADSETSCAGIGYAQLRIVEHANDGVDALRRYVIITRPVHQIGMVEVIESLDSWRAAAQCAATTAAHNAPARDSALLAKAR